MTNFNVFLVSKTWYSVFFFFGDIEWIGQLPLLKQDEAIQRKQVMRLFQSWLSM